MKSSVAEFCRQTVHRVAADGGRVGCIGKHRQLSTEVGKVPGGIYEQALAELTQRHIFGKGRGRGSSVYMQMSIAEAEAGLKPEEGLEGGDPAPDLMLDQPDGRLDTTAQVRQKPNQEPISRDSRGAMTQFRCFPNATARSVPSKVVLA